MRRIFSSPRAPARLPVPWGWFLVVLCMAGTLGAQSSREYDLKAVFLYNFATFVDWPPGALSNRKSFDIGILGEDSFRRSLDAVIAGEKINGLPLRAKRCQSIEEARQCQILFISASEASRLPAILQALRGRPVLTVADGPRFLEAGVIIVFATGARVELHINPAAAQRAGLQISSKLLRVAKIMEDKLAP